MKSISLAVLTSVFLCSCAAQNRPATLPGSPSSQTPSATPTTAGPNITPGLPQTSSGVSQSPAVNNPAPAAEPRWTRIKVGTGPLTDFHFVNAQTGYVVGENGLIRKTTDGGARWTTLDQGSRIYNSVFFLDAETGWVSGSDGTILKTTDGGETWETQDSGVESDIWAIQFVTPQKGLFLGGSGRAFSTSNGGKTWKELGSNAGSSQQLAYPSESLAFAFGMGSFYLFNGSSWTSTFESRGNPAGFAFSDQQHGWIYGPNEPTYETVNGGRTWKPSENPQADAIAFANAKEGMVVSFPDAYTTDDGGQTWQKASSSLLSAGGRQFIRKLRLYGDASTGWALSDDNVMLRWSR